MKITVFKDVWDKTHPEYTTPYKIYERIRNGKDRDTVEKVRSAKSKDERNGIKKTLPCILFSGEFTERFDNCLKNHSGRAILDLDHVEGDLEDKKAQIASLSFVEACFISPSGDGLKVVARIPADKEKHRGYYNALMQQFPQRDSTSINESRVCYSSYDPNIYVNNDAIEFTEYLDVVKVPTTRLYPEVEYKDIKTDYNRIGRATKIIREAIDGEKHKKLLMASKLMGGYVAGGLVEESEGVRILESEISKKNIDNFPEAQKTIRKGIEYGKMNPIQEELNVQQVDAKNSGIVDTDAEWEEMKYSFINGKERGATTHFKKFDQNFTWKGGEVTLIIARPNVGKTEFALQLMLMKSVFDGWKWAVFSPENYPAGEFFDTLIHTYIGKTTDPYFANSQMSLEEYERGYKFVKEHFFYVYPENHSVEEVVANFTFLVEKKGIKGTFIDPFNTLDIDYGMRQDLFISKFLTERTNFAKKYNTHDLISTHPKTMSRNKNGEYDVPDMYDIWGGSMWGNKVHNILVMDRPNFIKDPLDTTVHVHARKIKKQKLVGIPGTCIFDFQRNTNRYYIDGISPLSDKSVTNVPIDTQYNNTTNSLLRRPISKQLPERVVPLVPPKEEEEEIPF